MANLTGMLNRQTSGSYLWSHLLMVEDAANLRVVSRDIQRTAQPFEDAIRFGLSRRIMRPRIMRPGVRGLCVQAWSGLLVTCARSADFFLSGVANAFTMNLIRNVWSTSSTPDGAIRSTNAFPSRLALPLLQRMTSALCTTAFLKGSSRVVENLDNLEDSDISSMIAKPSEPDIPREAIFDNAVVLVLKGTIAFIQECTGVPEFSIFSILRLSNGQFAFIGTGLKNKTEYFLVLGSSLEKIFSYLAINFGNQMWHIDAFGQLPWVRGVPRAWFYPGGWHYRHLCDIYYLPLLDKYEEIDNLSLGRAIDSSLTRVLPKNHTKCSSSNKAVEIEVPVIQVCEHGEVAVQEDPAIEIMLDEMWAQTIERHILAGEHLPNLVETTNCVAESDTASAISSCDDELQARGTMAEARSTFGDMVYLMQCTRGGGKLHKALDTGRALDTVRATATEYGQRCILPSGARIFVHPQQYEAVVALLDRCVLKPHHVVISEAFLPLVRSDIATLPSNANIRTRSLQRLAMVDDDGHDLVIVTRTFLQTTLHHWLQETLTQSTSQAHGVVNPRT